MDRYSKHIKLIGEENFQKVRKSRVAVIGLGGLGGVVAELLARYGIGNLIICDGDKFERSNLNRQLLSTEKTIGENKAKTAAIRINEVNINTRVELICENLDFDKGHELLHACDVIADCLGDFKSKIKLEELCTKIEKPVVHAAIEREKAILSTVLPGKKGWKDIFGEKGVNIPDVIDPASVWIAASFQAKEIISLLCGKSTLQNGIFEFDISGKTFRKLSS